jgi:hypothetical protein
MGNRGGGKMKEILNSMVKLIGSILDGSNIKATKIFDEKTKITACRRGKLHRASRNRVNFTEILLTIGRPNYEERKRIKQAKKVGLPFPLEVIKCQKK